MPASNPFDVVELAHIEVDKLNVDPQYQRDLDEDRVTSLGSIGLRPEMFLALGVARYPDGSLWVYVGQHRLALAKREGVPAVPCVVVDMDATRAARTLVDESTAQRKLDAIELHKARLHYREECAVAVQEVVDRYGFVLADNARRPECIRGVDALRKIRDRGGDDHLDRVVETMATWRLRENIVADVTWALSSVFESLDLADAIDEFKVWLRRLTPQEWYQLGRMRAAAENRPGNSTSRGRPIAEVIIEKWEDRDGPDVSVELRAA